MTTEPRAHRDLGNKSSVMRQESAGIHRDWQASVCRRV